MKIKIGLLVSLLAVARNIQGGMFHGDAGSDASAGSEVSGDLHPFRLGDLDQIVQDQIGDVFIKCPVIPVLLEIQLQRFQLETMFIRDIGNVQRSKIGLACFGAD